MGSRSLALFDDLLDDLSTVLDADTLSRLREGKSVDYWPDILPREFAALALVKSFYKKNVDTVSPSADAAALKKFLQVNDRCKDWQLNLESSWDEVLFGELRRTIYEFLNPGGMPLVSSFSELFTHFKTGPGVTIGSEFNDFYSKLFSSSLSTTSRSIYRAYRCCIESLPLWEDAENIRYSQYGDASVVEGNRLRFVPKTRDISRTICIEPNLNMGFQLGLGHILEERLKTFFGIDLAKQPDINREFARMGSIDDSYSTIDLESASDSLSLKMLEQVLPRDFFSWLKLLRSPTSELPDGRRVELNMVSTMGNGFTFPLQTMLFSSIVVAAARARGFNLVRPRAASDASYGVFGDDIIVPTNCHYTSTFVGRGDNKLFQSFSGDLVRDVLRLLKLLGFVVNSNKSFFEGPFRESCGADYFRGQLVRGVYLKTLQTPQSRFVAINLLNRWSALTNIPLARTVRRLFASVPYFPVPRWESDDAGVKVPFKAVKGLRRDKNLQSVIYRKWVTVTSRLRIGDTGFLGKKVPIYNSSGLLISFLNGTIRSDSITMRSHSTVYRKRFGVAPNWDDDGTVPAKAGGWRWETATLKNLSIR